MKMLSRMELPAPCEATNLSIEDLLGLPQTLSGAPLKKGRGNKTSKEKVPKSLDHTSYHKVLDV